MREVTNIEKSMTVGAGTKGAYKGVSDKDVKNILGKAMAKNGLCVFPIEVDANVKIDRWEETDEYSKETPKGKKTKQSVFTDATCKYLLVHISGESQIIAGYGHGVDSQDKAAGKATTYALKNALLYTFMIPTGDIDDTDKTHSDEMQVPQTKKEWLNPNTPQWANAISHLQKGATMDQIKASINISKANEELLKQAVLS